MFFNNKYKYNSSAFTLLEILIVMGVVGTLATIAILVLNPTELLKQTKGAIFLTASLTKLPFITPLCRRKQLPLITPRQEIKHSL
ncbi:MAG: type II secretion system protein [Patescibacteria group bacterium]